MKTKIVLRIVTIVLIGGSIMMLNSCLDDGWDFDKISDEMVLTPGVAAPIAYGELSLKDLMDEFNSDDYVKEFDNSLLYIAYNQNLFSYPASEIINIPDQDFLEIFIEPDVSGSPFWLMIPEGDTVEFNKRKNGEFSFLNNERLDSINIKTMDLQIHVSSSFKHKGIVSIVSDSIIKDNQSFNQVIQISSDEGNFDTTYTINLSDYKVILDNFDPGVTNLPLLFELSLINSGNVVSPGENCNIKISFLNVEFSSIYGYVGDYTLIDQSGSVVLDLFDTDDIDGDISFYSPQFTLNVNNSFGLPIQVELSDVSSYSRIKDVTTPIIFTDVNPFDIPAPEIDSVGITKRKSIEINESNCNISDAMETFPERFNYTVSALANPDGTLTPNNFITDSSQLDIDFEVVLPIHLNANGFALEDTLDFDFDDQFADVIDFIDYFRMDVDIRNGMPMELMVDVFFLDENYIVLDTLFLEDQFFIPPSLTEDDEILESPLYTKSVEFDKEKINRIEPTKYLSLRATLNTAEAESGKYVKFFSYNNIYFKLKLESALNLNSREL